MSTYKFHLYLFAAFSAIYILLMGMSYAKADGINTYSHGYRMGQLSKFSYKGLLIKTGEGELLMGNESSVSTDDGKQINPWRFSSDKETYEKYKSFIGEYVIIEYEQLIAQIGNLTGDTDYRIRNIMIVDQDIETENCSINDKAIIEQSSGDRIGRITKVSKKGNLAKSYELTMQLGNSGNQFHQMTISDDKMYDCAINFLKSGKKVKISYSQGYLRNPLVSDTNYRIIGIQALKTGLSQ